MNTKTCQRCQQKLQSNVVDISNCDCSSLRINNATSKYLANTNYNCLCTACLSELNNKLPKLSEQSFPNSGDELVEGLHYYKENGFFVFTENYHILRGFCCESGCRHCAFGFEK